MIGYRDKTFCVASCANNDCDRKYTIEVQQAAEQWWGSPEAPICVSDFSLNCPAYKPQQETNNE